MHTFPSTDNITYIDRKKIPKHRFDFEVGYLIKSPCKKCHSKNDFPKCFKDCELIDQLQEYLAGSISCTKG